MIYQTGRYFQVHTWMAYSIYLEDIIELYKKLRTKWIIWNDISKLGDIIQAYIIYMEDVIQSCK